MNPLSCKIQKYDQTLIKLMSYILISILVFGLLVVCGYAIYATYNILIYTTHYFMANYSEIYSGILVWFIRVGSAISEIPSSIKFIPDDFYIMAIQVPVISGLCPSLFFLGLLFAFEYKEIIKKDLCGFLIGLGIITFEVIIVSIILNLKTKGNLNHIMNGGVAVFEIFIIMLTVVAAIFVLIYNIKMVRNIWKSDAFDKFINAELEADDGDVKNG